MARGRYRVLTIKEIPCYFQGTLGKLIIMMLKHVKGILCFGLEANTEKTVV